MTQPAPTANPVMTYVRYGLLAVAVGILVYTYVGGGSGSYPLVGQPAPKISLATLDGAPLPVGEELGKQVVVLNFWATWCPPCREELPEFSKLATQFPGKPVSFYSVCIDQEKDLIASVVNETQPKPPAAYDEGGAAATAFQVSFLPTTVLVAPDGVIHSAHIGYSTSMLEELRGNINALLAAAPAK